MRFQDHEGLPRTGRQYKGNLHSHTTNSDGHLTPEESVAMFKAHGYHFLCLSEHDHYTDLRQQFNTDDFILLPGLEASAVLLDSEESRHRIKVHHEIIFHKLIIKQTSRLGNPFGLLTAMFFFDAILQRAL